MKKNVASKIIAGALASAMVLSMAACGEAEQTGSSTPASTPSSSTPASTPSSSAPTVTPEPAFKFSIALPTDETHSEENQWYDKLVADLNAYTGCEIEWIWQDTNSYYDQLMMKYMSGNVADVMVVGEDSVFTTACDAGLFWDLTDYIDDYDNFASIPDAVIANASYNGRLFAIPRSRNLGRNGWGYRADWLNNLGLDEPTTWEAFEDMLYAFTYNDPDGNGQHDTCGLFLDAWSGQWDIMMAWFGVPNEWGLDADGNLIHQCMTPQFKTALAEFRELYSKGVINCGINGIADFTEWSAGAARKKGLATGLGGAGVQVLDEMRKVQTSLVTDWVEGEEEDIKFTLASAVDTGLGRLVLPTQGYNGLFAFTTKNIKTEEQLRKVLDAVNSLSDGEAVNLIEYGWEGLTYDLDDNGYVRDYTNEELAASGVNSKKYSNGFNQIPCYFIAEENARPVSRPPATRPINKLEEELKASNEKYVVPNYGASFTSPTWSASNGALDGMIDTAMIAYIRGEIDEAGLDAQLDAWWVAGGEAMTKEMNEMYKASQK